MNSLLGHLLVLDLADEKASLCYQLLAQLGADFIRIEKRGVGRGSNQGYPPENTAKNLDLETLSGRVLFRKLAGKADIILESFPPGYLKRKRVDYDRLSALNQGLVMVSITPFGQAGPRRNYIADDLIISAAAGLTFQHGDLGSKPETPAGKQSYCLASLFAACGIMLALRNRNITRKGRHIEISLQEAAASGLFNSFVRYFSDGVITRRNGRMRWDNMAGIFPCCDGHIFLTFDREWDTILDLMASDEFDPGLDSPKWKDPAYRAGHSSRVIEALSRWTVTYRVAQLFELGQAMRFPWAPVAEMAALPENPQLKSRGFSPERLPFKSKEEPTAIENAGYARQIMESASRKAGLLSGIRVLDFTWILAGPFATAMMADSGAEVIKVQSHKIANGTEQNNSYYFASLNRNKRSITLDMSRPETRELVLKLATRCDVIIQNFTPRVMENWGLGYEAFKKANPGIIMINLSAMGNSGPWRDFAAFSDTIEALSGMPGNTNPLLNGYPYSDIVSGLYSLIAALSALEQKRSTGMGASIEISEFEALCSVLEPCILNAIANHGRLSCPGSGAAPCGIYKCRGKDKWCAVSVQNDSQWQKLLRIMGNPEWALQSRFSTGAKRVRSKKALDACLENWTANYTARELVRLLQSNGIPCSAVNNVRDLADDRQLKSGFFHSYLHPSLGKITFAASPLKMSATPPVFQEPAPMLGEGNEYVFGEILGLSRRQITEYIDKKIIY